MSLLDDLSADEQNDDLRQTVRRLEKQLARSQRKSDALVEAVYEAIHDGISAIDIPPVKPPVKDRRKSEGEVAVLHISDVQLGKVTKTYNSEIAGERVQKLVDKTRRITERQRAHVPVRDIHVFLLGDEIEGELIFPGQAHQIDSSLYRQGTGEGPEIISQALFTLAETFENVFVFKMSEFVSESAIAVKRIISSTVCDVRLASSGKRTMTFTSSRPRC